MHKRRRKEKLKIQGNFHPMTSMAMIENNSTRLTILTTSSRGIASLAPGLYSLTVSDIHLSAHHQSLKFHTFDLKPFWQNFLGREDSMSSIKLVSFVPVIQLRLPSWPLIGWHIFNFFVTATWISIKLAGRMHLTSSIECFFFWNALSTSLSLFESWNFGKVMKFRYRNWVQTMCKYIKLSLIITGWIEMVLDRRLIQHDWRGLSQGITDNVQAYSKFVLLFERREKGYDKTKVRFQKRLSEGITDNVPAYSKFALLFERREKGYDHSKVNLEERLNGGGGGSWKVCRFLESKEINSNWFLDLDGLKF